MATTVIIPARNEAATIGPLVATFDNHDETHGNIYVILDKETRDGTSELVWANGGCVIHTDKHGKGEVVAQGVSFVAEYAISISHRIILCDGDYTGLTRDHITKIIRDKEGMVIGVPDFPNIDVPEHVITAWPRVSGFRCLPWTMIPENAHGYLLETQLNQIAARDRMQVVPIMMPGLQSPFQWPLSPRRMAALQADKEWGLRNGVL
jgi:hypothetical protein